MAAEPKVELPLSVEAVGEREILLTRALAASRRAVFDAWSQPTQLVRWFGPPGWAVQICELSLRVGGVWRFVMNAPGGKNMGMRCVFREVVSPDRLAYTEAFDDGIGGTLQGALERFPGEALRTVTFSEGNGVTTISQRVLYRDRDTRDGVLESGMTRGTAEAFRRLEALLVHPAP